MSPQRRLVDDLAPVREPAAARLAELFSGLAAEAVADVDLHEPLRLVEGEPGLLVLLVQPEGLPHQPGDGQAAAALVHRRRHRRIGLRCLGSPSAGSTSAAGTAMRICWPGRTFGGTRTLIVRPSGARTWRTAFGAVPAGIWICMVVLIFVVVWPAPRLRVLPRLPKAGLRWVRWPANCCRGCEVRTVTVPVRCVPPSYNAHSCARPALSRAPRWEMLPGRGARAAARTFRRGRRRMDGCRRPGACWAREPRTFAKPNRFA